MEENLKITLTEESKSNPSQALNDLITAAKNISTAADADFQSMQDTTWYKRLWQLVTFSKNNEIKMAQGASNLAKLQEIVMKAVLLISKESADLSNEIREHADLIETLANNQKRIAIDQSAAWRAIQRLKSGVTEEFTLDMLDGNERIMVMSAFQTACESVDEKNEDSRELYTAIESICGHPQESFRIESIDDFSQKKAGLLYRVIMEYVFLATHKFELNAEIMRFISVSEDKKAKMQRSISTAFDYGGASAIIEPYYGIDDAAQLCEEDIDWADMGSASETSESNDKSDALPVDKISGESEPKKVSSDDKAEDTKPAAVETPATETKETKKVKKEGPIVKIPGLKEEKTLSAMDRVYITAIANIHSRVESAKIERNAKKESIAMRKELQKENKIRDKARKAGKTDEEYLADKERNKAIKNRKK